jgi:hypothetical protein
MKFYLDLLFLCFILINGLVSFVRIIYLLLKQSFFEKKNFSIITDSPNKRQLVVYNIVMILACIEGFYMILGRLF